MGEDFDGLNEEFHDLESTVDNLDNFENFEKEQH